MSEKTPVTQVNLPANFMLFIGIANLILPLIGIGIAILLFVLASEARGEEGVQLIVQGSYLVILSTLAIIVAPFVIIGALKMKNLTSRKWAMTASILCIVPCASCCFLSMPIGIWALVVINSSQVKDAFNA